MKPTSTVLIAAAAAITLSACSPAFVPPSGATPQQIAKDDFECTRDSFVGSAGVQGLAGAAVGMRLKSMCMASRGWGQR